MRACRSKMFKCASILLLFYLNICASKPLNIILILADDLGWNDVSFHGADQIQTPNIDSLAYNGVTLNNFYAQATCTPSRAALLTGRYPIRYGFQGYPMKSGENRFLPVEIPTLPEHLKKLGYVNYLVGKWHLGYSCRKFTPTGRGFDSHFGYWNGYVGYLDYLTAQDNMTGFDFRKNFEPYCDVRNSYAVDVFTDKSVEIIREHDKSKPMFLMVSHLAPHTGEYGTELTVKNLTDVNFRFAHIKNEQRRRYADIVEKLDESVGKIVACLSSENLLQHSAIFFLSDNGGQTFGLHANSASNWPLKGVKFTLLNGGVKVPSVMYTPKLNQKGVIHNGLVHITDLFKTIYSAAGGNSKELDNLDSQDIWDNLLENRNINRDEALLDIDEVRDISGIIGLAGKYKLLKGTFGNGEYDLRTGDPGRGGENKQYNVTAVLDSLVNQAIKKIEINHLTQNKVLEVRNTVDLGNIELNSTEMDCKGICLFDMETDPLETKNLAASLPDVVNKLMLRLDYFRTSLHPQDNRTVDRSADPKYFNDTWSNWLENSELCKFS